MHATQLFIDRSDVPHAHVECAPQMKKSVDCTPPSPTFFFWDRSQFGLMKLHNIRVLFEQARNQLQIFYRKSISRNTTHRQSFHLIQIESIEYAAGMCEFDSSPNDETRTQSADSSKAYRKPGAFNCRYCWTVQTAETFNKRNLDMLVIIKNVCGHVKPRVFLRSFDYFC